MEGGILYLELFLRDIRGVFFDLDLRDFGPILFFSIWCVVLFVPLRGIDRRDELAQFTYVGSVAAYGVIFLMTFPIGRATELSPTSKIVVFSLFLLASSIRWMVRKKFTALDVAVAAARADQGVQKSKK